MAIHAYGNRSKTYANVVAFPDTSITGVPKSLWSSDYYPFEKGSYGPCRIMLHASDRRCIGSNAVTGLPSGDTIQVNVFVSFSNGDSWFKVYQLKDLHGRTTAVLAANGTPVSIDTSYTIPFAPRIKVQAVLRASDSISVGHGCRIDLVFDEMYSGVRRASYIEDVKTKTYGFIGDTKGGILGTATADTTLPRYSAALDCGFNPGAIYVWAHSDSIIRLHGNPAWNTLSYELQSSPDGTNWYFADSLKVARPGAGNGDTRRCLFNSFIFNGAEQLIKGTGNDQFYQVDDYPQKYDQFVRLKVTSDSRPAVWWARGHGTRFHLFAFE